MDKDSIITLPHSSLRQKSKKVPFISEEIHKLVKDMTVATIDWEDSRKHEVSVALAAVQVNALKRVVIIRNNFNDKTDQTFSVFINPEIVKLDGEVEEDYEGCLSIKNIYGLVPRYTKVKIKAQNLKGKPIRLTATGFLARVFQHEIDHTNGVLFIDHIKENSSAFFKLDDSGKLESLDYKSSIKNNLEIWS
jgi:peptide deformylase